MCFGVAQTKGIHTQIYHVGNQKQVQYLAWTESEPPKKIRFQEDMFLLSLSRRNKCMYTVHTNINHCTLIRRVQGLNVNFE